MANDHPFFFEALNDLGASVKGTMTGSGEEAVRRRLETEFGYRVKNIHEDVPVIFASAPTPEKKDDPIIFQKPVHSTVGVATASEISEDRIQAMHDQVKGFLMQHEKVLQESTKARLRHVQGKLNLLREFPSLKRYLSLKWNLWKAMKQGRKEVKAYEDRQWKAYDQAYEQGKEMPPSVMPNPFAGLKKRLPVFKIPEPVQKLLAQVKVFDTPDPASEEQMLKKQYYESVWIELQRFTTVLFGFYLACFLIAYYTKRLGFSEAFIVRIYDAGLFKQIVMILFSLFAVLSVRVSYLRSRLVTDALLILAFLVSVGWVW